MKRKISTHEKSISDFVDMLAGNRYLIPSFQREFVWETVDILRLWDSIYNFYPIGSILCWDTDIYLNIHRQPGGIILKNGAEPGERSKRRVYILDGQQRATSLLVTILGGKDRVRDKKDFDYSLYFDAVNGIFFFRHEYLIKKREIDPEFLIAIKDIHQSGPTSFKEALLKAVGNRDIENNLKKLQDVFFNYKLPLVYIKGFEIPDVSKIFERINKEGKELKSLDIMIARTFQNYQYKVEEDIWN